MEEPKDSLTFELGWLKASAVGRFAVIALLIFSVILVASAMAVGPVQILRWYSTSNEITTSIESSTGQN
ncbi:hypothetical protein [Pararhizobium antarcticum]|uniref:hypothetical protein n=1 Tax=Pararhizobium antarcticum TaxID=1798805 RepID=UPI001114E71B|nr:hypothetical protein [Pararhizobium antarcticum]